MPILTAAHNDGFQAVIDAELYGSVSRLPENRGFDAEVKCAETLVTSYAGDGVEHASILYSLTQRRTSSLGRLSLDLRSKGIVAIPWKMENQSPNSLPANPLCRSIGQSVCDTSFFIVF